MKIEFIKTGKFSLKYAEEFALSYHLRLKPYAKVESKLFRTDKQLLELPKDSSVKEIVLDERGHQWSSIQFSKQLQKIRDDSSWRGVRFIIGGPDGLPLQMKQRADLMWSLSNAVFPSDMAWFLAAEQVYRGFSILSGHPYHRE